MNFVSDCCFRLKQNGEFVDCRGECSIRKEQKNGCSGTEKEKCCKITTLIEQTCERLLKQDNGSIVGWANRKMKENNGREPQSDRGNEDARRRGGKLALRKEMIPCQSREAVVTVMDYCNGVMDGYLQHPRLEGKETVQSLTQLILMLDSLVAMEDCPNSSLPLVSNEQEDSRKSSVFRIQIIFREHYTWQGRLIWQDENREAAFRSALELMQLLDEILG